MPLTVPCPASTQSPSATDPIVSPAPSRPSRLLALKRTYLDAHRALASGIRRMVSAPLGLAWRLDIDVDVYMEVDAADAPAAATLAGRPCGTARPPSRWPAPSGAPIRRGATWAPCARPGRGTCAWSGSGPAAGGR